MAYKKDGGTVTDAEVQEIRLELVKLCLEVGAIYDTELAIDHTLDKIVGIAETSDDD